MEFDELEKATLRCALQARIDQCRINRDDYNNGWVDEHDDRGYWQQELVSAQRLQHRLSLERE
jgi:hypothetical protein